jgi:Putative Ig domain
LHISKGPEPNWTQFIPPVLFGVLGIIVLGLIVLAIIQKDQQILKSLADRDTARGLITFLIAFTTVGIAIILAISTVVLAAGDEGDKRFDRGKQVLSVLIGVLGTIVGFYFGAETKPKEAPPPTEQTQTSSHITTAKLPDGNASKAYTSTTLQTTGLTQPLTWSVKPALPDGLALDSTTGILSGTPKTATAKTTLTFTVTDSARPPISDSKKLDLEIK